MESELTIHPCMTPQSTLVNRSLADWSLATVWSWVGAMWLGSVAVVFAIDHGCSESLKLTPVSGELRRMISTMEHFGTPYGALLILITLWVVVPHARSRLLRTLCAALAAGIAANIIKLLVARTRPNAFDFNLPIWESFVGLGQSLAGGSQQQSFPSAHTAFAFGFAVMLGELFPTGRRWFFCLGAMVALQRVVSRAHFPSDVLVGAGVGVITARCYAGTTLIARLCDRIEARLFPSSLECGSSLSNSSRIESVGPVPVHTHSPPM